MIEIKITCNPEENPIRFPADIKMIRVDAMSMSNEQISTIVDKWSKENKVTVIRYDHYRIC